MANSACRSIEILLIKYNNENIYHLFSLHLANDEH